MSFMFTLTRKFLYQMNLQETLTYGFFIRVIADKFIAFLM